jgi:hypothetical protein
MHSPMQDSHVPEAPPVLTRSQHRRLLRLDNRGLVNGGTCRPLRTETETWWRRSVIALGTAALLSLAGCANQKFGQSGRQAAVWLCPNDTGAGRLSRQRQCRRRRSKIQRRHLPVGRRRPRPWEGLAFRRLRPGARSLGYNGSMTSRARTHRRAMASLSAPRARANYGSRIARAWSCI